MGVNNWFFNAWNNIYIYFFSSANNNALQFTYSVKWKAHRFFKIHKNRKYRSFSTLPFFTYTWKYWKACILELLNLYHMTSKPLFYAESRSNKDKESHVCRSCTLKRIYSSVDVEHGLIFAKRQIFIFSLVCVIISFRESAPQCFHSFALKFTNAIYSCANYQGNLETVEVTKIFVDCVLSSKNVILLTSLSYQPLVPIFLKFNLLIMYVRLLKWTVFFNKSSARNGVNRYIIRVKVIGWINVDEAVLRCENESKDK